MQIDLSFGTDKAVRELRAIWRSHVADSEALNALEVKCELHMVNYREVVRQANRYNTT